MIKTISLLFIYCIICCSIIVFLCILADRDLATTKHEVTIKFQVGDCIKDSSQEEWEPSSKQQIIALGKHSYETCFYPEQCTNLLNGVWGTQQPYTLSFGSGDFFEKVQCNQ